MVDEEEEASSGWQRDCEPPRSLVHENSVSACPAVALVLQQSIDLIPGPAQTSSGLAQSSEPLAAAASAFFVVVLDAPSALAACAASETAGAPRMRAATAMAPAVRASFMACGSSSSGLVLLGAWKEGEKCLGVGLN